MDGLLALPYFTALFTLSKWYLFRHETFLVFLSSIVPLISVIMHLWQMDKLWLRGDPFAYNTHLNAGNARFSRLTKHARLRWIAIFITLLVTSWALGLLIVVHTIITQAGTDCGPSFDPTASCRWSIRPIIGSCDCRIVIGSTHTVDADKEGLSSCVSLPEMLSSFPRAEYIVITPTPKSLGNCAVDDDEVLWITEHMSAIRLLSLPYQNITQYPKQSSTVSLTSLSLPYNFLMEMDADVLHDNKRLDHLSLEMNNISHLPKEILNKPGGRLEHLSLMGNPVCENTEYYGALEDLRDRGISPLCGKALWENRRITDEESREKGSAQPNEGSRDFVCGSSPKQDSLAFAMVYYKDACQLYRESTSSECLTICDEMASWVSYTSDGDPNLSLDEINRYLELISIRPFTTDAEMECMLAYINCSPMHTPDEAISSPPSIHIIAVMMSGGVTDCKHCPYTIR
ncbi:hypothetical protein FOL47_008246 [Perkinsus chesapeaki]|uniref:Uncharacterized protein n=1 Tax=Perkinsus chesapeaki TaxID=330153 RepID=A0A7J6LF63_PERCH|nr:hypothetical protein FOL47_008246 [Perkinsus chesapeaki]